MSADLPNGISEILEYLAGMARGYDNHLKWNEVAKLKADLMNVRERWFGAPVELISARCLDLGMRPEDVEEVAELVSRAQAGRRLVPEASYRGFRFQQRLDSFDNSSGS